ncbi:hypothetical protein [Pontimicrobium sp. MEBiC06410]
MKKHILFIPLLFVIGISFSQNKSDYSEIIKVVVSTYKSDSIKIYKRFNNNNNNRLLKELERIRTLKTQDLYHKYEKPKDSKKLNEYYDRIVDEIYSDSVTVKIENIKINFFSNFNQLEKKNKRKIYPFYKTKYSRKKRPIAFISFPLISVNEKKAIVYGMYICGGLCGSGGLFFLEKINNKWIIVKYEIRWVS